MQILNPKLIITKLDYTNSQDAWLDGPANPTPSAMTKTIWPANSSTPSVSVFVSGDKIEAKATFTVTPAPPAAITGARIEGKVNGLGLLVNSNVTIPAGATSVAGRHTGWKHSVSSQHDQARSKPERNMVILGERPAMFLQSVAMHLSRYDIQRGICNARSAVWVQRTGIAVVRCQACNWKRRRNEYRRSVNEQLGSILDG